MNWMRSASVTVRFAVRKLLPGFISSHVLPRVSGSTSELGRNLSVAVMGGFLTTRQVLDCGCPQVRIVWVGRVEVEPVDDVAVALGYRGAEAIRFCDDCERVQHLVVDQVSHLFPAVGGVAARQRVESGPEVAPPMQLQDRVVRGGASVERDLFLD